MKKTVLFVAAGAALFVTGYWAGTWRAGSNHSSGKTGPVTSAAGSRAVAGASQTAGGAADGKNSRPFTPGHPFVKGHAKEWLLSLATDLKDAGRDEIMLVELAQIFMTMDEESAVEVTEALYELGALLKSGDPAVAGIPNADDMVTGALIFTAFRLSQLNPASALALLKRLPEGAPDDAFKFVFARVARQNPAQAEAMLDTLDANRRKDAMEGILESMSVRDPAGALALADRHESEIPDHSLRKVMERLAEKDPRQAVALAVRRVESGKGPDALRQVLSTWSDRDRNAAEAWAGSYTGAGQWSARSWLVEKDAESDAQAALAKFQELQKSGAEAKEIANTANTIAANLARQNLTAARDWAVNLPPGPIREQVVPPMLSRWVEQDSGAASAWISTLPAGKERDESSETLANAIQRSDPASAFEWARNIQNESRRNSVLENVYSTWREQDAEAAKAAANALPPEIRQNLPGFKKPS